MTIALDVFRVIASCSSLLMLLSPVPMVYKMHKNQDTGVMSIIPLLSMLVNANTWMMYGYLDKNYVPLFVTFVIGEFLAFVYVTVFYVWTKDRAAIHSSIAVAALLFIMTSVYVILAGCGYTGQTRHEAAQVAGYISDVSGVIMYSSPLAKVVQVFKHKSAVFIPIHMACMGATNMAIWVVYSVLAKKWIIFVPCLISLSVGIFQVVLYFFIFNPKTHPLKTTDRSNSETQDDKAMVSVVIPSPSVETTDFVSVKETQV